MIKQFLVIKLIEYAIKVLERDVDKKSKHVVGIDGMKQLRLMNCKVTTLCRRMDCEGDYCENERKNNTMYCAFVEVEKTLEKEHAVIERWPGSGIIQYE